MKEKRCLEETKCIHGTTKSKQEQATQHTASAAHLWQCEEPRRVGPQSVLYFQGLEQYEIQQVLNKHAE